MKLNEYKDAIEKNDKKEKIRELNEKIVSLKIELSVSGNLVFGYRDYNYGFVSCDIQHLLTFL